MEANSTASPEAGEVVRSVSLGLIQSRAEKDLSVNMEHALERTREAARRGAQIICHQELYRTPYFPQYEKGNVEPLAETIPGESTKAFAGLARELGVVIILPLFEKDGEGCFYNSAAVLDEKGVLLESYRKIHLPHDPLFYEQNYFSAGNHGYRVFYTSYASFSVLICYDQWFPEAARICALNGAEILFYPTAIGRIADEPGGEENWLEAWETVQRSHAIANGVHVAAVNRVGKEGRLKFWGGSFVCDAFGKVLGKAGSDHDEILIVSIDTAMNQRIREGWGFHRNRRPETYRDLIRSD